MSLTKTMALPENLSISQLKINAEKTNLLNEDKLSFIMWQNMAYNIDNKTKK